MHPVNTVNRGQNQRHRFNESTAGKLTRLLFKTFYSLSLEHLTFLSQRIFQLVNFNYWFKFEYIGCQKGLLGGFMNCNLNSGFMNSNLQQRCFGVSGHAEKRHLWVDLLWWVIWVLNGSLLDCENWIWVCAMCKMIKSHDEEERLLLWKQHYTHLFD